MKNVLRWAALFIIPLLILAVFGTEATATTALSQHVLDLSGLILFGGVMKTGTYDIASLQAATNQTVAQIGESQIAEIIAEDNANFTAAFEEALSDLATTTTDNVRAVGSSLGGNALEVDEYGQGPTQKDVPGYLIGIPLKRIQFAIGWTAQWLKYATGADVATRNGIAQGAHLRRARYELQRAIFVPTNSTFVDHLGPQKASLPVKALINADSTAMANGPNGEVFDGATHTHYDANATLTAAVVTALINDVLEHRNGAVVRVYINVADVTSFSALTGFIPLQPGYLTLNSAANQPTDRLDFTRADNRQIGWFGAAEVWTKPWAVANYAVAADVAAPAKPLIRRVEPNDRGIHVAGEIESHPLRAEFSEWFYGFSVWNRTAMAVLRFNNGTYATPTLSY